MTKTAVTAASPAPFVIDAQELGALFKTLTPAKPKPAPANEDAEQQLLALIKDIITQHCSIRDTDPHVRAGTLMTPQTWLFSDQKWGPYILLITPYPEGRCFKPGPGEKINQESFDPDLHDRLRQLYCDLQEIADERRVILLEEDLCISIHCKTPQSLFVLFHNLVVSDNFPGSGAARMDLLETRLPKLYDALSADMDASGVRHPKLHYKIA